ncbi:MAG: STAS domain-containing protein [Solirubrobacteraceae bacterium]|nr:STAS domain-containing protein [Solirubrobacteraceae bacterium]
MSPIVPKFEISEDDAEGEAHVLALHGEIHVTTAPRLAEHLTNAIESGKTAIVLDMSGVEFIDSTGLSVLLNALRFAGQRQGRLVLVCTNPTVLRLFQITGLEGTFDMFDDRAEAIAYVTQPA